VVLGSPENIKVNAVASTQKAILVGTGRNGVFASVDAGRTVITPWTTISYATLL
jgi:hypothetical protein